MSEIMEFSGEYRFLSNFKLAPVEYDGVIYPSVENAYQAAKTLDVEARKPFELCLPHEAKRLGKTLRTRNDWEVIKESVMEHLVYLKFTHHIWLADMLIDTGDKNLVEGNRWGDTYWGVDIKTGEGANRLGKILMDVRCDIESKRLKQGLKR